MIANAVEPDPTKYHRQWQAAIESLISDDGGPQASYEAGRVDALNPIATGIDPLGADADTHYGSDLAFFLSVERARNAVRNHGLVEQGVNRLLSNLQLDTVTHDVDSGDEAVDVDLKAWHREWANDPSQCDYEGQRTLGEIANQSFFNQLVDGDIAHLPLATDRIQTLEAHQLRRPQSHRNTRSVADIIHGVEVANGRVAAYHFTPQAVAANDYGARYRTERYRAWDDEGNRLVWHLGFRHRFSQRRGISRLNPARNSMNGFDQLNWAHIHSAVRRSLISFLEMDASDRPSSPLAGNSLPATGERRVEQAGLVTRVHELMGQPAAVLSVAAGRKLEGWNANMPGSQFFEHAALLLSILAVNLDLPLSSLLLDGSLVNFHGGRMVADQARMRYRHMQAMQINGFYRPVWAWRVRQRLTPGAPMFDRALANAVKRNAVNPFQVTFRAKGWPYVKPAEDVAAREVAERRNLRSLRAILADDGVDLDDHIEEIIRDRGAFARRALEEAITLRDAFPDANLNVGQLFRELWYGLNPAGVELSLGAIASDAADANPPRTVSPNRGAA
jgi:capsid protein